jgi:hypothetical protein
MKIYHNFGRLSIPRLRAHMQSNVLAIRFLDKLWGELEDSVDEMLNSVEKPVAGKSES